MSVDIVLRDDNYGLAKNITQGVSAVLEQHSSVIVVEDDILVSPFFLGFMNQALDRYQDEARVGSISGYCYPVSCDWSETYFIRGSDCWGWATWRNRWRNFDPDGRELLRRLRDRNLTTAFDFDSAMGFTQMLEDQVAGRNDSWAVRWHASCFLRDLLILYPARALAQNIGHDGSGTHSVTESEFFDVSLSATPVVVEAIPIEESILGRQAIREFFMKGRTSAPPRRSVKQHVFTALAKLKSRLTR